MEDVQVSTLQSQWELRITVEIILQTGRDLIYDH